MDMLDPQDVAVLKMLAGANFHGGEVTLPSGRILTPNEMQALTSAYAPAVGENVDQGDEPTTAVPPRRPQQPPANTRTAMQRYGVAWWGRNAEHSTCACCQSAGPTYLGYNGGQPMGVRFCGPCARPGHVACGS